MNINKNNYEEWMINYIENNLSEHEVSELKLFLAEHPELETDLALFEQTILKPDYSIRFDGKEMLKKKTESKVIFFATWQKYSLGIAAALLLFAGIKLINPEQTAPAQKYTKQEIRKPEFAFEQKKQKDTLLIEYNSVSNTDFEKQYADEQLHNKRKNEEIKNGNDEKQIQQEKKLTRDIEIKQITESMEFAQSQPIKIKKPRLRMKESSQEKNIDEYAAMLGYGNQNQSTIVDKYNNTKTFALEMANILGFGNQKKIEEDNYKETSIKILGIEYYNRKKINNKNK